MTFCWRQWRWSSVAALSHKSVVYCWSVFLGKPDNFEATSEVAPHIEQEGVKRWAEPPKFWVRKSVCLNGHLAENWHIAKSNDEALLERGFANDFPNICMERFNHLQVKVTVRYSAFDSQKMSRKHGSCVTNLTSSSLTHQKPSALNRVLLVMRKTLNKGRNE